MSEGLLPLEELTQSAVRLSRCLHLLEDADVQSKDGLHPYRAALFFILRESEHQYQHRRSRQLRAAILSGDVKNIRQWQTVRLLGHSFGKSNADVARDLIDTYRALEDGELAP